MKKPRPFARLLELRERRRPQLSLYPAKTAKTAATVAALPAPQATLAPLSAAELRATATSLREWADGFDTFAEQLAHAEDVAARTGQHAYAWQMRAAIAAWCPAAIALFTALMGRCMPDMTGGTTAATETEEGPTDGR